MLLSHWPQFVVICEPHEIHLRSVLTDGSQVLLRVGQNVFRPSARPPLAKSAGVQIGGTPPVLFLPAPVGLAPRGQRRYTRCC